MQFEESHLCRALVELPAHQVASRVLELTEQGRDVSIRDSLGRGLLHVLAGHCHKFRCARAVPVVYQLCAAGIDVNAVDNYDNTCMHLVAREQGTYRIVIALLRCGADPSIKDGSGNDVRAILEQRTAPDNAETLHWFDKMAPGLPAALAASPCDVTLVERLLQSWCCVVAYSGGKMISLVASAQARNVSPVVVALLKRFEQTNELVTAVLAGSARRVKAVWALGGADIATCDVSYQYRHPHSPCVPQPLLAAAWEQDSYALVDALLACCRPDTAALYSNHTDKPRRPLYFHAVSGVPKPDKLAIVHRILRDSDPACRNSKGQTILFESIRSHLGIAFIKSLFSYGVDLAARDYKGRTARDYAVMLGEQSVVEAIDEHVLNMIRDKSVADLESLVLKSYEHVADVLEAEREANQKVCKKVNEDRTMRDMASFLQSIPKTQSRCGRIFAAIDQGDLKTLHRLARGQLARCQNKCGQTIVHRAILSRDPILALNVIQDNQELVHLSDNMLRTPLHYAHLLYGREDVVAASVREAGGDMAATDVTGRTADRYLRTVMTTHEYTELLRDVTQFESRILLREMDFEAKLSDAIKAGDGAAVTALLSRARPHADLARLGRLLFDCVDRGQPRLAAALLREGCDPDIWKQYEECDPLHDDCALRRCRHPYVSLHQRATQSGYTQLAELIQSVRAAKAAGDGARPSAYETMANFGMTA